MSLLSPRSSVVEHFLGKEEVIGSTPIVGSKMNYYLLGGRDDVQGLKGNFSLTDENRLR
jgi:hypothetical protein